MPSKGLVEANKLKQNNYAKNKVYLEEIVKVKHYLDEIGFKFLLGVQALVLMYYGMLEFSGFIYDVFFLRSSLIFWLCRKSGERSAAFMERTPNYTSIDIRCQETLLEKELPTNSGLL